MLPRHLLSWSQLRPGLTLLTLAMTGAITILLYGRVGALRGSTYRVYVLADDARGIIRGTEVWLAGERVGQVRDVTFRPVTGDTLGRLIVSLDVERRAREAIRQDSRVVFRKGGTPIGAPIVAIAVGSERSPMVRTGDTLLTRAPQVDPDSVRAAVSAAATQLPLLLRDGRKLGDNLRRALGGSAPDGGELRPEIDELSERAQRLSARMGSSGGTLPSLLRDGALHERARRAAAHAAALLHEVRAGGGVIALAPRDSALLVALASARREIATVRALLEREEGTAGRLGRDGALARQLRLLDENLRSVVAEARRDPGRWLDF
jgi:phospholipid/cholesterol/gamma-HCH transport system substrate-binding protein